MNCKESFLNADRINKIKFDIHYINSKIDLCKSIIDKFEKLPAQQQEELDKQNKNNFLYNTYDDMYRYEKQLYNLNKALEELETLRP